MLGATVLKEPQDGSLSLNVAGRDDPGRAALCAQIAACADGDRGAFRDLYAATSSKVFGIVCMVLKDRAIAEEVTQDVYLQLWRAAARFDNSAGHPLAWIASVARNKAIDRLRADRSRGFVAFSDDVPDIADSQSGEATRVDRMSVTKALKDLRPEYRDILLLAYFQGYTHGEVAEAMDIPVGTAKTWLRRGLAALREALE